MPHAASHSTFVPLESEYALSSLTHCFALEPRLLLSADAGALLGIDLIAGEDSHVLAQAASDSSDRKEKKQVQSSGTPSGNVLTTINEHDAISKQGALLDLASAGLLPDSLKFEELEIIQLTLNGMVDDGEQLLFRPADAGIDGASIAAYWDEASGTLTLTGQNQSKVDWLAALARVAYHNPDSSPTETKRTVSAVIVNFLEGADASYFEKNSYTTVTDLGERIREGPVAEINPRQLDPRNDNYGLEFIAWLRVTQNGDYTFYTDSDDGSMLWITSADGVERMVVDNDGLHANQERYGSLNLVAGYHRIRVRFFESGGGEVLSVHYQGPGISKTTELPLFRKQLGDVETVVSFVVEGQPNPPEFIRKPVFYKLAPGESFRVTSKNLGLEDRDTADHLVKITVDGLSGGRFKDAANDGKNLQSFTLADVKAGNVFFVYAGGNPAATLTANDGARSTTSQVAFTDSPFSIIENKQIPLDKDSALHLVINGHGWDDSDAELRYEIQPEAPLGAYWNPVTKTLSIFGGKSLEEYETALRGVQIVGGPATEVIGIIGPKAVPHVVRTSAGEFVQMHFYKFKEYLSVRWQAAFSDRPALKYDNAIKGHLATLNTIAEYYAAWETLKREADGLILLGGSDRTSDENWMWHEPNGKDVPFEFRLNELPWWDGEGRSDSEDFLALAVEFDWAPTRNKAGYFYDIHDNGSQSLEGYAVEYIVKKNYAGYIGVISNFDQATPTTPQDAFIINKGEDQRAQDGDRGIHLTKPDRTTRGDQNPSESTNRDKLPNPILPTTHLYMKRLFDLVWNIGFGWDRDGGKIRDSDTDQLPMKFWGAAYSENLFVWDMAFVTLFAKYSDDVFNAISGLENFYARQWENGQIWREITKDGDDFQGGTARTPNEVNPPLFAWAELAYATHTGDVSRLERVLPALEKHLLFLSWRRLINTGGAAGLYYQTQYGSGFDNTPNGNDGNGINNRFNIGETNWNSSDKFRDMRRLGWVELTAQMAQAFESLGKLYALIGREGKAAYYEKRAKETAQVINEVAWDDADKFYYNVEFDGSFRQASGTKVKSLGNFWVLAAGVSPRDRAEYMLNHLRDQNKFWTKMPFPTLSKDHPWFQGGDSRGRYWLGGVWAPTNYMVIEGIYRYGDLDLARRAVENYLKFMDRTSDNSQHNSLMEVYDPETGKRSLNADGAESKDDFVGWTGLGPVAMLIENYLGFRVNGIEKSLLWDLKIMERHGIENLRVGIDNYVDIIASAKNSEDNSVTVAVSVYKNDKSPGVLNLKIAHNLNKIIYDLKKGTLNLPEVNYSDLPEFLKSLKDLTGWSFVLRGSPAGLSIDQSKGTLTDTVSDRTKGFKTKVIISNGDAVYIIPLVREGTPAVSGSATQGQTLTASGDAITDADGLGTISWQWQRKTADGSWTDISGANAAAYKLTEADVGSLIRAVASYTDGHGARETVPSAATATVANVNDAPEGTPAVSGSATQGQTLTASGDAITDADGLGTISWQWQRKTADGSWTDISGANAAAYKLTEADVGSLIRAVASYTDGHGARETVPSAATATVANVNDAPEGTPAVSGSATQGQTLTASGDAITDADGLGTISWQWQRKTADGSWTDISGANAAAYKLTEADVGSLIRAVASYTDGHGARETVPSAATATVANVNDAPEGTPAVSGSATQGQTLTASGDAITDADGLGTISWQWQRKTADGSWTDISGANAAAYKLTEADVGSLIRAVASYTDGHGARETVPSAATATVANVNDAPEGTPAVSGSATQGQTLTASGDAITDADGLGTISWQWQRKTADGSWTDISGANAAAYKLTEADVGSLIRAVASYTDGHGARETVPSAATATVANVNDAPEGTPAVSGSATQGQTLTASGDAITDADGLGTISWQWQRKTADGSWTDISGANAAAYKLTEADVGSLIRAVASYTDGHGARETVPSAATATVANVNDAPEGTPAVSGSATQGQTLTASGDAITDADGLGTISWQWQRKTADGSWTDISGANAAAYKLTEADVGSLIRAVASYTDGHGARETVPSAATATVANVNDAPEGTPAVSGSATQGQTLTASGDAITDADGLGTISWQWQRKTADGSWTDISGANAAAYKLTEADVGSLIRAVASYTDGHGARETVPSAATATVANVNDAPEGTPAVSGSATQGQTLTASGDAITDADGLGTISWQWQRKTADGSWTDISGANAAAYKLTEADVGSLIRAVASYTDGHGARETVPSAATATVANVNDAPEGTPAVSGSATQGQTLTASGDAITDADGLGTISWQWQRKTADGSWTDISGANAAAYKLTEADVGSLIRAVASYTDGHGARETVPSAATATVANVNDAPEGTPAVSGSATQGQTLTASGDAITDADGLGTISWQWQRKTADGSWTDISGANAAAYKLTEADVGSLIRAVASYTDGHGARETVPSAATATVANVNDAPEGTPAVSGSATQGQTLTASGDAITDADGLGTISWQWQRKTADGSWTDISGANAAAYKLTEADVGSLIRAVASYTDGHGARETVPSAATATVANVNDAPEGTPAVSGSATQGQTLTASGDAITDADGLGTISWQWQRKTADGSWTDISGANAAAYKLTEADVGSLIRAVASYTDGHGARETVPSAATATVANVNDAPEGTPAVSGSATQGQTLTASGDAITDADGLGTISWQWQRKTADGSWTDISGANAAAYKLTEADVGSLIRAVASYTDGHGARETVPSAATATVANVNDAPEGTPAVSGSATQGQTLTASGDAITDADGLGTISWQWQRKTADGSWTDISGANAAAYKLTEADVGSLIRAVASYTDGHGARETVPSAATATVANVNDAPEGTPAVSGSATQGQTLTASGDAITDADGLGTISWQWQRKTADGSWTDISGANAAAYKLTEADVGSLIRAVASYTDGHGARETVPSAATATVANVNDAPEGTPAVSGSATQGQTLTASGDAITDADGLGTISWQWQRKTADGSWTDISGANAAAYKLTEADVGSLIRAVASYTDGHGARETVPSAATATVANVNDAPEGTPAVSGSATQGQTLTASGDAITDADGLGTISWQWQRKTADGSWTDISGANAAAYKLTEADVGSLIRAVASYTDGHGARETVPSAATATVANVNDAPEGTPAVSGSNRERIDNLIRKPFFEMDPIFRVKELASALTLKPLSESTQALQAESFKLSEKSTSVQGSALETMLRVAQSFEPMTRTFIAPGIEKVTIALPASEVTSVSLVTLLGLEGNGDEIEVLFSKTPDTVVFDPSEMVLRFIGKFQTDAAATSAPVVVSELSDPVLRIFVRLGNGQLVMLHADLTKVGSDGKVHFEITNVERNDEDSEAPEEKSSIGPATLAPPTRKPLNTA